MNFDDIQINSTLNVTSEKPCPNCKKDLLHVHNTIYGLGYEFICHKCFSVYIFKLVKVPKNKIDKEALKDYKKKIENDNKTLKK